MKIGNTNLEININNTSGNTSKLYLLEDNDTKPIKKDEIKVKNTVSLIPANSLNLTTADITNKENATVIDVAMEIKAQFDDVPLDKKINLAEGMFSIVPIGGDITKLTTNYIMIGERKKKIDKSLEEKNPKETLAQTVFIAKNTWAVINNGVKLANYLAEESYSLGKISKNKLSHFEKGTNTVNNINNALVLPFAIADVAYNYDSMKSYKDKINSNKDKLTDKEIKIMKDTYNAKKVTFALSALSLGALGSSLIFKSTNATTIVFVSDVLQKFSKFLEDEKARQSVKDTYNLLKSKI